MTIPFLSDLRQAARGLRRAPTVTASAVLCLALGIGATAAISSAVRRALLEPLPFTRPERLVAVPRVTPQTGPMGTWPQSAPNYVNLARGTRQLSGLAAMTVGSALLELPGGGAEGLQVAVTGNLFPLLGVRAFRGRLLRPEDGELDQPPVAVLDYAFWRDRLGGDPALVGRTLPIDGEPTTIVGITPAGFRIPYGSQMMHGEIWMPLRFTPAQLGQRRSNYLFLLGRLAPGATVASAQAEIRGLFRGLVAEHPQLRGEDMRVAGLQADSVRGIRPALLLLFGAVVMVLLIAAGNVAALLLARGVGRRREMAVRSALGVTRWGAMRPVLAEGMIIGILGTALGLALAAAGVRTIGALAAARIPQLAGLGIDGEVAAFAIALAFVVTLFCAALPAWRGASVHPQEALGEARGGAMGRGQHRALRGLVAAEIALSMALLIGAGLVLRGFALLSRSDPGFDPARVLTLRVAVPAAEFPDGGGVKRFLEPALASVRALPGVEAAGAIDLMPYDSWGSNSNILYEGRPTADPTTYPLVEERTVEPGFFRVTGQRLLDGRLLRASDDDRSDAAPVVVVNHALAERDFGGASPVGKRFHLGDTTFATIVGEVSDIRNVGPFAPPAPEMYWTYRQSGLRTTSFPIMVRVRGQNPAAVLAAVRSTIEGIAPSAAITDVRPMEAVITGSLGRPRFYLSLLGSFAAVALLLAVAGLYGVLSYTVAQRTREIGIRAALGSTRGGLVRLVAFDGVRLVAVGLALGAGGGAVLTRFMESMLYGVSRLDAPTWLGAALALTVAALGASLIPARRAAALDPMEALRAEG